MGDERNRAVRVGVDRIGPYQGEQGDYAVILERERAANEAMDYFVETGEFLLPGDPSEWGSVSYWNCIAKRSEGLFGKNHPVTQQAEHFVAVLQETRSGDAQGIKQEHILAFKNLVEKQPPLQKAAA